MKYLKAYSSPGLQPKPSHDLPLNAESIRKIARFNGSPTRTVLRWLRDGRGVHGNFTAWQVTERHDATTSPNP